MQQLLVEEVTEFLGRAKHQRRGADMQGYRNGYGKPRRLTMRSGTVTVRRPRVRDLDERFESGLLPLFTRRTHEVRDLLPELYLRGMNEARLVVGDGNLGLWSALGNIFPGAEEQRCWNHRLVNLLTQVPKQRQGEARELLTKIPHQTSARQAQQKKRVFQNWCLEPGYERAAELIDENWEQMVSFYRFPRGHWRHLGTSNVVESPFAALRLRTDAAKRFKKVANATAVVWKMLLLAERKFRRINSPELLPAVAAGQQYHDGLPIKRGQHQEAAA